MASYGLYKAWFEGVYVSGVTSWQKIHGKNGIKQLLEEFGKLRKENKRLVNIYFPDCKNNFVVFFPSFRKEKLNQIACYKISADLTSVDVLEATEWCGSWYKAWAFITTYRVGENAHLDTGTAPDRWSGQGLAAPM